MGMVVRTNTMANNAFRQLNMNNTQVGKSLEKLSSGFRINRAGDDASGLAISEKMKAQIKGLETASSNSQDGISLIQTAEGALTEVHDMLNRMVELAGKASNGTMDNPVDRKALQDELDALKSDIDRIAAGTNFNGIKLLDGSLGGGTSGAKGVPAVGGLSLSDVQAKKGSFKTTALTANTTANVANGVASMTVTYKDANGKTTATTVALKYDTTKQAFIAEDGKEYKIENNDHKATDVELSTMFASELNKKLGDTFKVSATADKEIQFDAKTPGASTEIISIVADQNADAATKTDAVLTVTPTKGENAFQEVATADMTVYTGANEKDAVFSVGGKKFAFVNTDDQLNELGKKGIHAVKVNAQNAIDTRNDLTAMASKIEQYTGYKPTVDNAGNKLQFKSADTAGTAGNGLTLQIGDTADDFNKLTVSIDDMSTNGLGIASISVTDQTDASAALAALKDSQGGGAINIVSAQRAKLGALQNRLEHTINNLDVAAENMTSANMRIRDTDMAKEMMAYTKMNVLTQAAQAMLAQANQQPQSVLQLLQ